MITYPHIAEKKIEAIKDEFHEWNDVFIQPGFSINDLMTREECARAVTQINSEVRLINDQIAEARLEHARGKKQIDGQWVFRAGKAIRYKRNLITAINAKRESIPKSQKSEELRQTILDVIREDIDEDRMQAYVAVAKSRMKPVDKSNSGGN